MRFILLLTLFVTTLYAREAKLIVYSDTAPYEVVYTTSDNAEIADELACIDVRFEQWEAEQALSPNPTQDEILQAYASDVERIKEEGGFAMVDVISIRPDNPNVVALRQKFLKEHVHTEDEVRFFVEGSGHFFLHADGKVYSVLCEKSDLISIPANYTHWFDMTLTPCFTAIRFFTNQEGWVAHYTEDDIADNFIQESQATAAARQ